MATNLFNLFITIISKKAARHLNIQTKTRKIILDILKTSTVNSGYFSLIEKRKKGNFVEGI